MKYILFSLLLITFFSSSYAQEIQGGNSTEPNEGWTTENNAVYSIKFPKDWTLDQSGKMGTLFFLMSPFSTPSDQFSENFNLLEQDLTGMGIDLDQFTEISEAQIKKYVVDGKIELNKRKGKGTSAFHHMIYSGKQEGAELRFEQYYWIKGEKAFILTFTCKKETAAEYAETSKQIFESFRLKG